MNEVMKHRLKLAMLPALALVLVLVAAGYYSFKKQQFSQLALKVEQAMEELNSYLKNPESVPTEKQLTNNQVHREALQKQLSQWHYTYRSIVAKEEPLTNLEFKEELKTLEDRYAEYRIPIQAGLGFKEFTGGSLPGQEELQLLTRQFSFVTLVIDLLIKNNVEGISEINREKPNTIQSTQSKKVLFHEYPLGLIFKINHANLIAFLNDLLNEPSVLEVRNVKIVSGFEEENPSSLESRLLEVQLILVLKEYAE